MIFANFTSKTIDGSPPENKNYRIVVGILLAVTLHTTL